MSSTTKNIINTNKTVSIISTAMQLLKNGDVRLHRDEELPTLNFRDFASTQSRVGLRGNLNAFDIINAIYSRGNGFGNEFSCSLTGLLAIACILETDADELKVGEVQANGTALQELFENYFSEETINLVEFAFHPWTQFSGDTLSEEASANYQRRMRRENGEVKDTQVAYQNLAKQILMNMKSHNGDFVPAREDYRAVRKNG